MGLTVEPVCYMFGVKVEPICNIYGVTSRCIVSCQAKNDLKVDLKVIITFFFSNKLVCSIICIRTQCSGKVKSGVMMLTSSPSEYQSIKLCFLSPFA